MKQMTPEFVVNAEPLTRHPNHQDAPVWWGIVCLILIELSVVAAFTVSYIYLRLMNSEWPPPGYPPPDLTLPTWTLALMLVSCVTMHLSGKHLAKNNIYQFVIFTFLSVGMASIVLAMRWQQMAALQVRWDEHVYGSLLWTISGFHFTHVVSAVIGTAAIGCFGIAGFFNEKRQIGVVADTLYWNFVAVAWLPFYVVLYLMPRM